MFISAFTFALNLHFIHKMAGKIHPFVNSQYSQVAFLFLNGILSQFTSKRIGIEDISIFFIGIMCLLTFSTLSAQYLIVMANNIKQPSLMMPFGYISIMVGFTADLYLFQTDFTFFSILGIILTSSGLLSGYLVTKKP